MRLNKIKIAGFKSFVDPTTIMLPSQRVAIVGPNGCGKSNIIDAVSWVLGESSPKYLRGEALTDVIFNGSSARKPVGQASVELIFDNSDAVLGGDYARFSEVSVKRMINRDSDSTYYLNNTRCRKRDVVDLLLGTGLGPRSYSIIGQNNIVRIIEAKPEDLRAYLEEAAGISKYKERRHETELRMGHTKENLSRVQDVLHELDTQLNQLQHQANVAEKFKTLQTEAHEVRGDCLATEWRDIDGRRVNIGLAISQDETALEAKNSGLTAADTELMQIRQERKLAEDAFQAVQQRYYAVGNEITRVEQDILHHEERRKQWDLDLKQAEHDSAFILEQRDEVRERLEALMSHIALQTPKHDAEAARLRVLEEAYRDAEERLHDGQTKWDDFQKIIAKTTGIVQVETARMQQLEARLQNLRDRNRHLQDEVQEFHEDELTKQLAALKAVYESEASEVSSFETKLKDHQATLLQHRNARPKLEKDLNETRTRVQKLQGQLASLEALQQTALGRTDKATENWLERYKLRHQKRLADAISVDAGFECAVEKVLGSYLQAVCVDNVQDIAHKLADADFENGVLTFFKGEEVDHAEPSAVSLPRLSDKLTSSYPLNTILAHICVAEDLKEAKAHLESLQAHESIITKDGVWLSRHWLKVDKVKDPSSGVFEREKQIKVLREDIAKVDAEVAELLAQIDQHSEQLQALEREQEDIRKQVGAKQQEAAEAKAEYHTKKEQYQHLSQQYQRKQSELDQCVSQMKQIENECAESLRKKRDAEETLQTESKERDSLQNERDQVRERFQAAREALDNGKDHLHEIAIAMQTAKSEQSGFSQTKARLEQQLASLTERKQKLLKEIAALPDMEELKLNLTRLLDQHVNVETELTTARNAITALQQAMEQLEGKRSQFERDASQIRQQLETRRVDAEGLKVKSDTLLEQIASINVSLEEVLQRLPADADADALRRKYEQLQNRINRLGPINLLAIDEYATCKERKSYLDQQVADLETGLETLQQAIAKIDKETRVRFKETFDQVNAEFQRLFPTIFGGGKATLELVGDDLLDAGVTLMASPPGKRNSSIYLLSGGEKSLTAIALIFAIFRLNPAPFCLLDEVDAALDDANVVRFTRLVEAMADKTQFIFISHNKITIELGEHLIGVTMNEPGVSRLVSVDVQKAISLASA